MGRQFKWAFKLTWTDFKIKYKPRCDSKADDDALARRMTHTTISVVHFSNLYKWEDDAHGDSKLHVIIQDLIYDSTFTSMIFLLK